MTTALVCGAGGFIGHHLVRRLKADGYWVRGVDLKKPEFSETHADEFTLLDLRDPKQCAHALEGAPEEIYQLAADMGGMGFIESNACDIMHNNVLINANMIRAAAHRRIKRYFFASSACVYRDMKLGEPEMDESEAYPARPDNEYGWEKLYSERMAMTYGRYYGMEIRIARFQNCYGPEGTWCGGREKAPAAICRKVAQAQDGGEIEIWGDGSAVRSYTYVDDMVDGVVRLMQSDLSGPVNIGSPDYVSVIDLVRTVEIVAGKNVWIHSVKGPVGVASRNFSNKRIFSVGWRPRFTLMSGIERTYPWIKEQVERTAKSSQLSQSYDSRSVASQS